VSDDISKWTIQELLARYELEPELSDVFVEGKFDKEVLTQAFSLTSERFAFYEIDTVHVPKETVERYGLTSGNKQRVMALAKELVPVSQDARFICLVDRDLDHWFGEPSPAGRLRWTIHCSLELHFLTPEVIKDILITTGRAKVGDLALFATSVQAVLRSLYILRIADRQCAFSLTWVSPRRYLSKKGDMIEFDVDRYKMALLTSNGKSAQKAAFDRVCSDREKEFNCDVQSTARGHDFTTLMAWAMTEFSGYREFASESAIERLFVLLAKTVPTLQQEVR
jgi:hypothetical protein